MKMLALCKKMVMMAAFSCLATAYGDNQTETLSPIRSGEELPFKVKIKQAELCLPNGLHSGVFAVHDGKWLLLSGRTNGLHGFNDDPNNFPPSAQNTMVYVIDPKEKVVFSRSLTDPNSGLTQEQVDYLSVTSPQFYQWKEKLYITGGYGVDTSTGNFSTKDVLTSIDIHGLMRWVMYPGDHGTAASQIRQLHHPLLRVTGGYMNRSSKKNPTLLIFGQDFQGFYFDGGNGNYTQQVRRFRIHDHKDDFSIEGLSSEPADQDPNYRRRDLNVVPIIHSQHGGLHAEYVAYSGVFTPTTGIWTVPVTIDGKGFSSMMDPADPAAFKQGMNNYVCPTFGLFSKKTKDMYTVVPGGISFGYFENGQFETDSEIPFINQITTIRRDKYGIDSQFLMKEQYPVILSQESNPGNQLLFGAGALFVPVRHIGTYKNEVIKLDNIKKKKLVGYIVGGIQSTVPNTSSSSDSAASPYIFEVFITPKK